jgi:hypothetical protein
VIERSKSKVFTLKKGGMNMVLTYNGMYKNYALFNVEINVGGGSPVSEVTCVDSDGGKNFMVKGEATQTDTTGSNFSLIDNCKTMNSSTVSGLIETYCGENQTIEGVYTQCEYGCFEGACLTSSSTAPFTSTTPFASTTPQIVCSPGEVIKDCYNVNGVLYEKWWRFEHTCKSDGTGYITEAYKCEIYPNTCQEGSCFASSSSTTSSLF